MRRILLLAGLVALLGGGSAQAAGHTVKTMHFDVVTGPHDDTHCDVIGDLYTPNGATAKDPAPAILTTNGFGGSKDGQAGFAKSFADHGYVVLSYSGLGFGGSGCKIELDDPDWDGKAGKALITFLGKLDYVVKDAPGDPRVGMIGGSYGGQIQFAVAGVDPRLDTIIPQITWHDLSYSLAPNNTTFTSGVRYATPGVPKLEWTLLFSGVGQVDGLQELAAGDPSHLGTCGNFDPRVCPALAAAVVGGYPNADSLDLLRHASVSSYLDRIKIPVFLTQGQSDTLFDLQESAATYRALRARDTPVKLLWRSAGHSGGDLGDGEFDDSNLEAGYESRADLEWFDWYLRGLGDPPKLDFSYFQDWVPYTGDAAPAVGSARSYPAEKPKELYLSGANALVDSAGAVQAGSASFVTPAAGAPTSYTETSAVDQKTPVTDAPGTTASFTSGALAADLDVVGIPKVTLRVSAPTFAQTQAQGPAGMLSLFLRLEDVAPDGSSVLPHRLISPVRIPDVTKPVEIELPGIVHRFAKGHRLRLVVASSDAAYKGNQLVGPVTIAADPKAPGVLTIPESDPAAAKPGQPDGMGGKRAVGAASLPKSCASRRAFTIHLAQKPSRVRSVTVTVNGKTVKTAKGKRITAKIDLRGLPKSLARITVEVRTKAGKTLRSARTYRTCTPKKR